MISLLCDIMCSAAEIAGVDKLNTTRKKTVSYNGAKYRISEPSRTQRKGKKYQVTVQRSDGKKKTVAWGDSSREDYLVHKDKKRRDNFQSRFAGIKKKDGFHFSKDYDKFWKLSQNYNKYIISPMPGYSTHCDTNHLSPFINWKEIIHTDYDKIEVNNKVNYNYE